MTLEEIKKLADLARIDMSDEEMEEIAKDFDTILAYIGQVEKAASIGGTKKGLIDKNSDNYQLFNITREDIVTNKSSEYTENILADAPDVENGFLKVKQIL